MEKLQTPTTSVCMSSNFGTPRVERKLTSVQEPVETTPDNQVIKQLEDRCNNLQCQVKERKIYKRHFELKKIKFTINSFYKNKF